MNWRSAMCGLLFFCAILKRAMGEKHNAIRMLVIDTCGERAAVGLSRGDAMERERALPDRHASAAILGEIRALLSDSGESLAQLDAVAVVTGPGSFTGVRTGLAVAKGLCEAAALPLAVASRLAMLTEGAGMRDGFAALNAGRQELYVREVSDVEAREFLCTGEVFAAMTAGREVVVAEEAVADRLSALSPRLHALALRDAIGPLLASLHAGGVDVASIDANYVRGEDEIYRKPQAVY